MDTRRKQFNGKTTNGRCSSFHTNRAESVSVPGNLSERPVRRPLLSRPSRHNRIYAVEGDVSGNCHRGSFCEKELIKEESSSPTPHLQLGAASTTVNVQDLEIIAGERKLITTTTPKEEKGRDQEQQSDLWDGPSGSTGTVKRRPSNITIKQKEEKQQQQHVITAFPTPLEEDMTEDSSAPGERRDQSSLNISTSETKRDGNGKRGAEKDLSPKSTGNVKSTSSSQNQEWRRKQKVPGPRFSTGSSKPGPEPGGIGVEVEGEKKLKMRKKVVVVVGPMRSKIQIQNSNKVSPSSAPLSLPPLQNNENLNSEEEGLSQDANPEKDGKMKSKFQKDGDKRMSPSGSNKPVTAREKIHPKDDDDHLIFPKCQSGLGVDCHDADGDDRTVSASTTTFHSFYNSSINYENGESRVEPETGANKGIIPVLELYQDYQREREGEEQQHPVSDFRSRCHCHCHPLGHLPLRDFHSSESNEVKLCISANEDQGSCSSPLPLPMMMNHDEIERKDTRIPKFKRKQGSFPPLSSLVEFLLVDENQAEKIYTDWANHYLEKARSKRHIQDLQVDVTDGVILAEVIEAVTNLKIDQVNRKPKTASHMLENIQACLVFLTNLGVGPLDGINSRDIRDGHLKSILSLFFQLSRFKQQQKQQDRDRHNLHLQRQGDIMMQATSLVKSNPNPKDGSKLPSAFGLKSHQTSIPLPSSLGQSVSSCPSPYGQVSSNGAGFNKKLPQEKGKTQHYSNPGSVPAVKPTSGSSSRSTSPSASGLSFIPTPRSSIPSANPGSRTSLHEKHLNNTNNAKNSSGPSSSSSTKSSVRPNSTTVTSASIHTSALSNGGTTNGKGNSSMLEKFKFFKDKDKSDKFKGSTVSKRTSSSSGFSSARSERSDSSVSLCGDNKTGSAEKEGREKEQFGEYNGSIIPQSSVVGPSPGDACINGGSSTSTSTPRLAIKGFRQKIGKALQPNSSKEAKLSQSQSSQQHHSSSPRSSRKESKDKEKEVDSGSQASKAASSSEGRRSSASESQGKARGKSSSSIITDAHNGVSLSGQVSQGAVASNPGFLRQPKPSSSNSSNRDSRNRFSGTGIPTRNSLIVTNQTQNDQNNSVHSSMTSINGLGSNGTGIPKPTAAVKGTAKQQQQQLSSSHSKETLKDCQTIGNASLNKNKGSVGTSSSSDQYDSSHPSTSNKVPRNGSKDEENVKVNGRINNMAKTAKPNEIVSVAMVAPMPVLSTSASVSSVDSSSQSLSHSQMSTLSHSNSNSSEASVIPANKSNMAIQVTSCQSNTSSSSSSNGAVTNGMGIATQNGVEHLSASLNSKELVINSGDNNPGSSKVSPMSVFGSSGSGSSSMGSINLKCAPESSGTSSSEMGSNGELQLRPSTSSSSSSRPVGSLSLSPNNGNEVIPECDEDDALLNVTPMEPLTYEYVKSSRSGHTTPGFLSPKSGGAVGLGPCLNGNGRILSRHQFNPFGDASGRTKEGSGQGFPGGQYAASLGENEYSEIDNFDVNGGGYLSDGDLLTSGNNGNHRASNDGYLSESGTSMYRRPQSYKKDVPGSGMKNINQNHGKHNNLIPEDSFDDSSSISSGISDINEIPTDLTSSSVNSESSPYASLQRGGGESSNKRGEELHKQLDPQSIIYRVVGSRNRRADTKSPTKPKLASKNAGTGISLSGSSSNGFIKVGGHQPPQNPEDCRGTTKYGSGSTTNVSLGTGANNGVTAATYSQLSSSSHHKRSLNSLDSKTKKGMIGLKEDYYSREMGERLIKEEQDRYRNGNNGSGNIPPAPAPSDGKRSQSARLGQSPQNFGYVRRSTGCGIGSGQGQGHSVSNTKYSIPIYPGGNKVTLSGMKDMLTADEFKAAHAALAMATHGQQSQGGQSHVYSMVGPNMNPAGTASPRTRTKVKISGGTQTTNDLHEIGSASGRHSSLGHGHPQHHYGGHHPHPESEYAASVSSRNSGSFRFDGGAGYKSMSLTTPTATQLSQSIRERLLGSHSLPKGATSADYAALLAAIQQQHQHSQIYGTPNASKERMSRYLSCKTMNDGSMSDNGGYSNYSEIQAYALSSVPPPNVNNSASPYSWMRHSTGYASSITSAPTRLMGAGSMTEAESLESLSSSLSMAQNNGQGPGQGQARSNTLSQVRSSANSHQRDAQSPSQSPRLNRSNSISGHFRERTFPRSTKSEKLYPSMMQREEGSGFFGPEGAPILGSPVHGCTNPPPRLGGNNCNEGTFPLSSTTTNGQQNVRLSMSPYSTGFLGNVPTKEDDVNASSLSLVSSSSMYSSHEDKHAHEVRKLRRDLIDAQEKVQTLTNQLSTNAHVVAAFEQSLSNMTQRIQNLTCTAEQKDTELVELKHTIELLRKQSIEAGLTVASMTAGLSRDGSPIARQLSADSVSSINSISSACSCTSHSHSHASSPSCHIQTTPLGTPTHGSHGGPHSYMPPDSPGLKKKHGKNKGWLRSSFTKAFSRSKSKPRNGECDGFDEDGLRNPNDLNGESHVHPHSHHHHQNGHGHGHGHHKQQCAKQSLQSHPQNHAHHPHEGVGISSPLLSPPQSNGCSSSSGSHSPRSNTGTNASSGVGEDFGEENKSMDELKKQLREKEMVLTDIRLEALTSAHQLESLKETVNKMRNEMLSLKQDNERLQKMVTCKSLTSSQSSLQMVTNSDTIDRRLSASEVPPPSSSNLDVLLCETSEKEGKRIVVTVFLGCHGACERYINSQEGFPAQECNIGSVSVSNKTKWDVLDAMIKRAFKEYLGRIDPVSNLGLSADSILSYIVGEVLRSKESLQPELLPCGYLVGDVTKIRVCLKGATQSGALDALAFETLVPKSILQRYISLLSDHGRIILCGPSGTGKSYLARKIGEYLVARCGKDPSPEAIATFSADHKNSKELRQYLGNLAEQCENGSADLPSVIILDNLHQVSSFGEVFSGYLNSKQNGAPVIIGTMTQSTAATPNLQLHHNFRWVLFGNHLEPVKGLLVRFLSRRLVETDVQNGSRNLELARIMDWIPKVWSHVNRILETHNSSDVTIGPRLFLSCPTDVANSQIWFTDLWHYSVVPYIMEAVKEGIQLYGKKAAWEDPCQYLLQTYPWTESHGMSSGKSSLLRLRPEDVGYDTKSDLNSPSKSSKGEANGEQDPLMNMLMRLQEAANYSGPQSNESDNTSLDSRTSLDKDYIATA